MADKDKDIFIATGQYMIHMTEGERERERERRRQRQTQRLRRSHRDRGTQRGKTSILQQVSTVGERTERRLYCNR